MTKRSQLLLSLTVALLATACVSGRATPPETEMVRIDGGLFTFGSEEICYNAEENGVFGDRVTCAEYDTWTDRIKAVYPTRVVYLPAFEIDVHEVSIAQYQYCVAMGDCTEPGATDLDNGIYDYYYASKYLDHPVVNVTWDQAAEYCASVGKRLPTEYEWERAAAGPSLDAAGDQDASQKRTYPFQENDDDVSACQGSGTAVQYCGASPRTRAVGESTYDRVDENGVWIYDLAGNVSEWVLDPWVEGITCAEELANCDSCFDCQSADNECQVLCRTCESCKGAGDLCFRQCSADEDLSDDITLDLEPGEDFPDQEDWPEGFEDDVADNGIPICIRYPDPPDYDTCGVTAGASDCGPAGSSDRGYRGGNFNTGDTTTCTMRAADRSQRRTARDYQPTIGFRCARSAE